MAKIRQRFNDVKRTIWFYIQILIGQVPQWHSAIEAVTDSSVDQGNEGTGQNITTGDQKSTGCNSQVQFGNTIGEDSNLLKDFGYDDVSRGNCQAVTVTAFCVRSSSMKLKLPQPALAVFTNDCLVMTTDREVLTRITQQNLVSWGVNESMCLVRINSALAAGQENVVFTVDDTSELFSNMEKTFKKENSKTMI